MDFLKNIRRFDFLYGGKPFSELDVTTKQSEKEGSVTTVYTLCDGLKITSVFTRHSDACEWVNWLENTSDEETQIISELWDCSVNLPLGHEEPPKFTAYLPDFDSFTCVYAPIGSTLRHDEFCSFPDRFNEFNYIGHLKSGSTKDFATSGGRSSEKNAPFFNIHKNGKGYIVAIGWTGQWNCRLVRNEDDVLVQTKIEDTHFKLLPGEKLRTSSVVIMPYEGTVVQSQNKWRRLVKEHFSLIGAKGRDKQGPLCAGIWGGMKTSSVLERIETIRKNKLPFEYIWMDAGWYGAETKPTPDEFEGDWSEHTGDWRVSKLIHPGGLKDVSEAVHKAGMKFLLWLEPERLIAGTPITEEHPEYFIVPKNPDVKTRFLKLGDENAWNYCFETLSGLIDNIGIDCYRQDFNTSPIWYWRKNDEEDRQGITEIKHINGLYRLWDALLEKFPNLLIDNCASGGRRIDIETMRRSIPLWRTDCACYANGLAENVQCHNLSFSQWLPYSGTGTGRMYDTYRIRSSYAPALMAAYPFSERDAFGDDSEKMSWLKERLEEYKKVREFMSEDFYPLTEVSDRKDTWCALQYDRPCCGDGVVQVFRREKSPYEKASFALGALEENCSYSFTDADNSEETVISSAELSEKGFIVNMTEKESSKIFFYKKIV